MFNRIILVGLNLFIISIFGWGIIEVLLTGQVNDTVSAFGLGFGICSGIIGLAKAIRL